MRRTLCTPKYERQPKNNTLPNFLLFKPTKPLKKYRNLLNNQFLSKISTGNVFIKIPSGEISKRAVKNGDVWCTGKYLFQATDITGELIVDFHHMLTGQEDMHFLYKLK